MSLMAKFFGPPILEAIEETLEEGRNCFCQGNRISPGWKTEQNGEDGLHSNMWSVDPKALGEHLSGKI